MPKDEIKKWRQRSSKVLLEHPRVTLIEDIVELPDGKTTDYVYEKSGCDSVAVIAINDKGQILIEQEYSYPPDVIMWQLPGGGVELGESLEVAAKRELKEETGYSAKQVKYSGFFHVNNRRSAKKQHVFIATDLALGKQKLDLPEFIKPVWFSLAEVEQMIAGGQITNINLLAALQIARHKLL